MVGTQLYSAVSAIKVLDVLFVLPLLWQNQFYYRSGFEGMLSVIALLLCALDIFVLPLYIEGTRGKLRLHFKTDSNGFWCSFMPLYAAVHISGAQNDLIYSLLCINCIVILLTAESCTVGFCRLVLLIAGASLSVSLISSCLRLSDVLMVFGTCAVFVFLFFGCCCYLHSFLTVGEGLLLCQSGAVIVSWLLKTEQMMYCGPSIFSLIKAIIGLTAVIIMTAIIFRNARRWLYGVLSVVLLCTVVWLLYTDSIMWMLQYVGSSLERVTLLCLWFMSAAASIVFAAVSKKTGFHVTVKRKFFHVSIVLIFWSGVAVDPEFVLFASVLATCLFLLLEVVRLLNFNSVSGLLNDLICSVLDEKDQGPVVLSHVYLLVGCFMPLWVAPKQFSADLRLHHFAGIISVGIGDAVAAVVGSYCGNHKWPAPFNRKSIEGTLAAFIVQFIVSVLLVLHKLNGTLLMAFGTVGILFFASALSSLMEAFTCHVDNLVLPLYTQLLYYFSGL